MKSLDLRYSNTKLPGVNQGITSFFKPSLLSENKTNKQSKADSLNFFFKPASEYRSVIQRRKSKVDEFQSKPAQHTSVNNCIDIDGPPDKKKAGSAKPATPCPNTVSIGALKHFNHSDLPETEKETTRTELGVYSQMVVGPGPDHSGHCMKEALTTVSNNCPKEVYTRGEKEINPCSGNKCLDINRYGEIGGVKDDATSFIDMHRTRFSGSLLEGTGKDKCEVVCEQLYTCDRKGATKGKFRITRKYEAGTFIPKGKAEIHITTGSIEKKAVR